ncbi:MAG TPA: hypothetical protein VF520_14055 [Thermoleophilaceae bacterium]
MRLGIGASTMLVLGALVCAAVGAEIQSQGAVSFLGPLIDLGLGAFGLEQLTPAGGSTDEASLTLALLFVAAFVVAGVGIVLLGIAATWGLIRGIRRGRVDERWAAAQPRIADAQQLAAETWESHGRPAVEAGVRRGRAGWRFAKPRLRAAATAAARTAGSASRRAGEAVARRRDEQRAALPPGPAPHPLGVEEQAAMPVEASQGDS